MYSPPNLERMAKLKISGLPIGTLLLYCHDCDYQIENAAHRPICPNCQGDLYTTRVAQGLVTHCQASEQA
jgi:Zn finger protein HypA/HybF involved in hydrogenase expression